MLDTDLNTTIDELEQKLLDLEDEIARLRLRQAKVLHRLDMRQVHRVDGARSMQEWTRGRLDVSAHTARDLVDAARQLPHQPEMVASSEGLSFERIIATSRLIVSEADEETIRRSFGFNIAAVDRMRSRQRRITHSSERDRVVDRFICFQDSLDNSSGRIAGELPGFEYVVIRDAVEERADQFGDLPGPVQTRAQRRADALVSICQDSREPIDRNRNHQGRSEPLVTVFFDAAESRFHGELGAEIQFGPRVGPAVLDRILCEGRVQLVGLENGKPVVASDRTRAIPPEMRRFVAHRDGGCTVAGCHSRYRLQAHHIRMRSNGGDHEADNLTTLCWFHHHVVVHGLGFRIDPDSPPQQRRFLRNVASGVDPPA
ncbi:MAG: DUF222 domain-containing protein [Acidimicrobiia bacterium]|nr:DUF222 domain-containing protein [Acidimicrobiia bacterium]